MIANLAKPFLISVSLCFFRSAIFVYNLMTNVTNTANYQLVIQSIANKKNYVNAKAQGFVRSSHPFLLTTEWNSRLSELYLSA